MKNARVLSATIAMAVLGACTAEPDPPASAPVTAGLPLLVRNAVRNDAALQALARGRLHLDPQGCLRVGGDDGPFVIWHHDSRIERSPDGRLRITDGYTGNSAHVGDEMAMGGGHASARPTQVTPDIPEACANGEFWIGGQLMSEAERQKMLERERNWVPVPSPE